MGRLTCRTLVWMGVVLAATLAAIEGAAATTGEAGEIASSDVVALNDGDTGTRVAGASGYHAYLIVIHTGERTARCVQVNLYREQSATVAPPSVREIELYYQKDDTK